MIMTKGMKVLRKGDKNREVGHMEEETEILGPKEKENKKGTGMNRYGYWNG